MLDPRVLNFIINSISNCCIPLCQTTFCGSQWDEVATIIVLLIWTAEVPFVGSQLTTIYVSKIFWLVLVLAIAGK